jgi:ubiquitin-protein ligase
MKILLSSVLLSFSLSLLTVSVFHKNKKDYISVEFVFSGDYPLQPPKVRIISPRFKAGTGHVLLLLIHDYLLSVLVLDVRNSIMKVMFVV